MRKFSFVAYDNHGNLLGYMTDKPKGKGFVAVWKDDRPKYINTSDIGRLEVYNLQAINRTVRHGK